MLKTIGLILVVIILSIIFITPVRNFMNSLIYKDKRELKEEQTIGTVSGYNPRVEEIQKILKGADFDPGSIDGVMGGQTRVAIRKFQKEKGLKLTGKIDSTTQLALNREKEILKETPQNRDRLTKIETDLFLDKATPLELKVEDSKEGTEDAKKKAEIQDEIMSYRLKSKDRIKQIQVALKKAGFYKGEIDGKEGTQTKRAIKVFQKSKGLVSDGIVGSKTWGELEKYLRIR